MFALGLQGSPRIKGNSDLMLAEFMGALKGYGARTQIIQVTRSHIEPCKELTVCEKKGICPIDDDMGKKIYALLRQADIIVAASPVFFYNVSAQLKALIDRCQTLWARRYMLKLKDPGHATRRGFLIAVGATKGKQLFDGFHLTAKYFYDALAAEYAGSLTFRGVEGRGDILEHPTMREDVARSAEDLMAGLADRRKVLFTCSDNACRSQMAAAFARFHGGNLLDVRSAGGQPAADIHPAMVEAMVEKGIDMGFLHTQALTEALESERPDTIIALGDTERGLVGPDTEVIGWDLPDGPDESIQAMRRMRDQIEEKVKTYIDNL